MTRILAAEPIPSFSRQAGSFLVCRHLPHKGVWSQRDVATQAAKGTAGLHEKKYKILKSVFTSPYGLLLVLFCLDVRTTTHDILVLVLPVFFLPRGITCCAKSPKPSYTRYFWPFWLLFQSRRDKQASTRHWHAIATHACTNETKPLQCFAFARCWTTIPCL